MKRIEVLKKFVLSKITDDNIIDNDCLVIIGSTIFDSRVFGMRYATYDNKILAKYLDSDINNADFVRVTDFRQEDFSDKKIADNFKKLHGNTGLVLLNYDSEIFKLYRASKRNDKLEQILKMTA
jgi:hypothetical protein